MNDRQTKYFQDQIETANIKAKDAQEKTEKLEHILSLALWAGLVGGIAGLVITSFIDQIRTVPVEYGWLQLLGMGMFLMVAVYSGLFLRIMREK